jgi:hypothetical protein
MRGLFRVSHLSLLIVAHSRTAEVFQLVKIILVMRAICLQLRMHDSTIRITSSGFDLTV